MALCSLVLGSESVGGAGAATPTLTQLVGQRLVIAFSGTTANGWLRARIREGQIGGVLLFSSNVASPAQLTALTASLQAAARAGGQPPLLIAADQEGGEVKRMPWAPPYRSAFQLGTLPATTSISSGAGTGQALHNLGVNVDLAPVADVPVGPGDFIQRQRRAFSTSRFTVANNAAAFAQGLEQHGVWPALKHFPGLGRATVSTDSALVTITASRAAIQNDLLPYKVALRRRLAPLVMLSTAIYTSYDRRAAAWSPVIITELLRHRIGFKAVTITDSMDAAAAVRHQSVASVGLRSAKAGADMILVTGSQTESQAVYTRLLAAANTGALPKANLVAAYNRIAALKKNHL